jgi:hypothetical protein
MERASRERHDTLIEELAPGVFLHRAHARSDHDPLVVSLTLQCAQPVSAQRRARRALACLP